MGHCQMSLESQIAPGTAPTLSQVASITVNSLRVLAESFSSFDPDNGRAVSLYTANQKALNWLCP